MLSICSLCTQRTALACLVGLLLERTVHLRDAAAEANRISCAASLAGDGCCPVHESVNSSMLFDVGSVPLVFHAHRLGNFLLIFTFCDAHVHEGNVATVMVTRCCIRSYLAYQDFRL
jgi:hypothetical protein